ncbi:MAG: hypothetical protein K5894_09980 [Lachnospiraceae bacterium]|nr:hypothetical protein [Lachnospiraceae bacterium]
MRNKLFAVLLSLSFLALTVNSYYVEASEEQTSQTTLSENAEKETVSGDASANEDSEEISESSEVETKASYVTYPEAVSSNYTFVTKDSAYKSGTWMFMIPGKSITFDIGNESGTKIKGARKSVTWTISGNSSFTVKKGKLKLDKNVKAVGPGVSANDVATGVLSTEYNGEKIYLGVVALTKTKYVGYLKNAKLTTTASVTGRVGSTFDLRNLNSMTGQDIIASYKVEKSGVKKTYLYFAKLEELAPKISLNKKGLRSADVTYDETGSITKIKPLAAGTYKITYKLRDGSGKKFTLKLIAEN